VPNVQRKTRILHICRCDERLYYSVSVSSGRPKGLTIRELFTAVAIVFDRAIQCETFSIGPTWADVSCRGCNRIWAEFFSCLWSCLNGGLSGEISQ